MDSQKRFQTFMRSTFGVEPGGELGARLEPLCHGLRITTGERAEVDLSQDRVVYLSTGSTKLVAAASGQREQIVAFQFAGDVISMPAGAMHHYSMTALTPCTALVFPAGEFFDAVAIQGAAARVVMERLRNALHRCRDKAVGLGQKNAQERLASFLIAMAERIGAGGSNTCVLELPMSRRDIGASLGLTIETVSRQLGALRKDGLLETKGRSQIVLLDLAALAQRSGLPEVIPLKSSKSRQFDLDQGAARARQLAG